jgi:hypothetical protein
VTTAVVTPAVIYGAEVQAWPMWITLNGGQTLAVTRLMAILSLGLCLVAYYGMVQIYAKSRPTPTSNTS